ncbi:hypothetical protein Moror_4125 [Moniliophthora roreri MCA 2997]|uniref:Uncharacterized protein n=1 Tax=Moniliophthora roreri (strain MCA 2997) TaxID=1381753 RepID=V2XE09_MONRO|nr:hypothetical protein Moror_4125 [Moniliophthora roreri MCA 2997]
MDHASLLSSQEIIGCFDPFLLIPLRAPSSHDGFMVDIEWVSGWEEKGDAGNQAHTSTHRRIGDRIDYKLSNRAPVHLARDALLEESASIDNKRPRTHNWLIRSRPRTMCGRLSSME